MMESGHVWQLMVVIGYRGRYTLVGNGASRPLLFGVLAVAIELRLIGINGGRKFAPVSR